MANQTVNLNGFLMRIRDNGDSSYSTTAGKYIQEIVAHNALAITDTAAHDSALLDVSALENQTIFVTNTLNQAVTVSLLIYDPNGTNSFVYATTKSVAAGTSFLISNIDFPILNTPFMKCKIRIQCSVAPASGSVSTWIMGY